MTQRTTVHLIPVVGCPLSLFRFWEAPAFPETAPAPRRTGRRRPRATLPTFQSLGGRPVESGKGGAA